MKLLLKGRVGRSDRQAYAYITYKREKLLSEVADKRLKAIKEFTELGSGFKIAMRDLSIRGAGDILGSEQSGFIDTIGIELYLKMLNEEVSRINGGVVNDEEANDSMPLLSVGTHIDNNYVREDELKIEIHKMINSINSYDSLINIKDQIEDRFGRISEEMLIYMYEEWFNSMKDKKGIESVKQTDTNIDIIFNEKVTNAMKPDKLFVSAYTISKNFKLSYVNRRIVLSLSLKGLDKHWIYYLIDLLTNI